MTVIVCGRASGIRLVNNANNIYETWTVGGPPGAAHNNSGSGWFQIFKFFLLPIKENPPGEAAGLFGWKPVLAFFSSRNKVSSKWHLQVFPSKFYLWFYGGKVMGTLVSLNKNESRHRHSSKNHFPKLSNHLWRFVHDNLSPELSEIPIGSSTSSNLNGSLSELLQEGLE